MHVFLNQDMRQRKLCILNHFAFAGTINITSLFIAVVLILRLFVETYLENRPSRKSVHRRDYFADVSLETDYASFK